MNGCITQGMDRDLGEHLRSLDTRFLLAMHHGDVDVVRLARIELANRGIGADGRWVGFAEAGQQFGI
jgi:hypothetical protein